MVNCGNCIYWVQTKPYRWGSCMCPIPFWVEVYEGNSLLVPDTGIDCASFIDKED
jgi:hypothetical protein